jgi:hypothetical protein
MILGHDVEIAGIGRQIMRRALELEEHRCLQARTRPTPGMRTGRLSPICLAAAALEPKETAAVIVVIVVIHERRIRSASWMT